MSRVLITGATGMIGTAIVRRLLADPEYEVRVSDQRAAPRWMREGCEVHAGDLRMLSEAKTATDGCTHVIHLAALDGVIANLNRLPHTLIEANNALYNAVIRAALDLEVERFTYISSSAVFERASELPTTESHLPDCPAPRSAYGFSKLTGEMYCRAAHEEHGLQYTICRPFGAYGPPEAPPDTEPGIALAVADLIAKVLAGQRPLQIVGSGEQTRTLTHVEDIADGVLTAMSSPKGRNEDFNISASRELTVAEIARIIWESCGEDPAELVPPQDPADLVPAQSPADVPLAQDPEELALEHRESSTVEIPPRPSVEKAKQLLGWQARIEPEDGIAATVAWIRERGSIGSPA